MNLYIGILAAAFALTTTIQSREANLQPQNCTQQCLVQIEGLQSTYSEGSRSKLVVDNRSAGDLYVNVAVEGFRDGSWEEITDSIIDKPRNARKTVMFRKVRARSSFQFVFSICDISILQSTTGKTTVTSFCSYAKRGGTVPSMLRLRVDVFSQDQERIVQRVLSKQFRATM
jgi:hypothetical protein